jgi:glycosyltransferase involved in cell wall biosynthesis
VHPLIFFSQLYYPDNATTAIILTDLAEDLASYGLNVKVICAQPTYLVKKKSPKREVRNKVTIQRVWTFLFDKNKNLGRMLNSLSCFFVMLANLLTTEKEALLVFNTNPALLPLLGFISKKLRNQQYVILVHDLWPELPAHTGMIRKGGMLYRIIDFLMTLSLRHAGGIIVLSNAMKKSVLQKVPGTAHKIYVIHNWADADRVFPVAKENIRLFDGLGIKNKKIVMYSGNLGRYQPLEVMIHTANELKNRKDILFLFVGNGGKKAKIQNMAENLKLDNVKFLPFQPQDRLSESLSMADVSLMGIYPENEGVIMPSKLYSLLAVGRPIICVSDPKSEVADILEQAGAGIQSSVNDPKELGKNILAIVDDQEKVSKMGQNGRTYFLEHFERKIITKQWYNILSEVIK